MFVCVAIPSIHFQLPVLARVIVYWYEVFTKANITLSENAAISCFRLTKQMSIFRDVGNVLQNL